MDTTAFLARLPGRVRGALITLRAAGAAAYLVGGAPRDLLLGRPVRDFDLATDADTETIARCFPGALPHGSLGTVSLGTDLEITRFRADGAYLDGRHPAEVRFGVSLDEDLARRDFTINALAFGFAAGSAKPALVDPGTGRADLAARTLRAVGEPEARFAEDPLRILRGHRLAAALDFTIDAATRAAMAAGAPGLARISPARIGIEVVRGLRSNGPRAMVETLTADGALPFVLPGITPSEIALAAMAKLPGHDPEIRLAALLLGTDPATRAGVYARVGVSRAERRRLEGLTEPLPAKLSPAAARDRVALIGREEAARLVRLLRAFPDGSAPAKVLETVSTDRSAIGRGELSISSAEISEATGLADASLGVLLATLVAAVHADPSLNEPRQLRALVRDLARSLAA